MYKFKMKSKSDGYIKTKSRRPRAQAKGNMRALLLRKAHKKEMQISCMFFREYFWQQKYFCVGATDIVTPQF